MSSGIPQRTFNIQFNPNFAGPVDVRSVGTVALDRSATQLYEGLLRYEKGLFKWAYAYLNQGNWAWRQLVNEDDLDYYVTTANIANYTNTTDLNGLLDDKYDTTGGTIGGNVTITGTTEINGTTTMHGDVVIDSSSTLTVNGVGITGATPTAAAIAYDSTTVELKLNDLESRLAAVEKLKFSVLTISNLQTLSDHRNNPPIPFEWNFVHNGLGLVLNVGNDVISYTASPGLGTFRFMFNSISIAELEGKNDMHSVQFQTTTEQGVTYFDSYGYNEWNGGGYPRHQAPVTFDETIVLIDVTGWYTSGYLTALDGQQLSGTLVVQRLA